MRATTRTLVLAGAAWALLAAAPADAAAQEGMETDVTVSRAVVSTGVQEREPVGEATTFPADVGTVYFYTVFEGDFGEAGFEHVWVRDGEEMARVPLTARGPRWRTWSSKAIPPEWAGSWTVRVVDTNGNEIASTDFTVGG